ncbi:MAG: winged helix-turn-helix domain-containing protein [Roseibium sp.]|uniref:winged helix-turn-helix domain-containing protein n=1 Tax=Roseibium sp. TaxID=1936156 RepID=UPI00329A148F
MAIYAVTATEHIVSEKIYFIEAVSEMDAYRKAAEGKIRGEEQVRPARVEGRVLTSLPPQLVQTDGYENPEGNLKDADFRRELTAFAAAAFSKNPSKEVTDLMAPISYGRVTLDPFKVTVHLDQDRVNLPRSAFLALKALMANPERVLSREALVLSYRNDGETSDDRSADATIKRIRAAFRKVDPDFDPIQTQYAWGYRMAAETIAPKVAPAIPATEALLPQKQRRYLKAGHFLHDRLTHESFWKGQGLNLTAGQTELLVRFMEAPNSVFTRESLMVTIRDHGKRASKRAIDAQIKRIKDVIKSVDANFKSLTSVYGVGYKFDTEV